jgi:DNA-binding transcriptional LysR family regulator
MQLNSAPLHGLDLNKLNTFVAVVDAGGVGKAGRALGRTSSAVSQSLGSLESALSCKLFDRVGRQLVLTRAGRELYARVSLYQSGLAEALEAARGAETEVSGVVGLGLFLGFPRRRLCDLMTRFGRLHPRAAIRTVYGPERELEQRLLKNQLDYVLSFRAPEKLGQSSSPVASTEMFSQNLVLVTGPRYLKAGFDLGVFRATPVVDYYQADPLIRRWLAHHHPNARVSANVRFWAATTDLVLDLVLAGAGVGVLPDHVVEPQVSARRLRVLGPKRRPLVDRIWLNEPRQAYRDATLKAFRALALEVLQS